MLRSSTRRQQLFREALSREAGKAKKNIDRGKGFRPHFPYGVVCLWIIFFGVVGYLLFFSPFLMLSHITIVASGQIRDEEMKGVVEPILDTKWLRVLPARNFFLVPQEKITQAILSQYPVIERIEFVRTFPNKLTLIPSERTKLLLWCAGGPCAMIDAEGEAWFHEESFRERYSPIRLTVVDTSALPFELGKPLPVSDYLAYFSHFKELFPQQLGQDILPEATTPSRFSRELRVVTTEGWSLLVNIDIPLEETLLSLAAFFEERRKGVPRSPLLTVDARVPGRIFFTEVVAETKLETEGNKQSAVKSTPEKPKKER